MAMIIFKIHSTIRNCNYNLIISHQVNSHYRNIKSFTSTTVQLYTLFLTKPSIFEQIVKNHEILGFLKRGKKGLTLCWALSMQEKKVKYGSKDLFINFQLLLHCKPLVKFAKMSTLLHSSVFLTAFLIWHFGLLNSTYFSFLLVLDLFHCM